MDGPGEYVADRTEGIARVEDLPPPRIERRSRDYRWRRCPFCGKKDRRLGAAQRVLHDLGDARSGRPLDIHLTYSKHQCSSRRRCFNADMDDLALPECHYTPRVQQKAVRLGDLFDHRHLFVKHHLTPAEKKTFPRITRGLPHLRTLRQIMDEVYRLFDRRCRTETALAKLAKLRRRVRRFQRVGRTLSKLFTPNLEKALVFLDDRLLPATSNAVERGNRRYRKAQRNVYSVRTAEHIRQRIALDMERDQRAPHRQMTTRTLHLSRTGTG